MSFRYTNNLVGALKHRLLLESSARDISQRHFTGQCRGVEVVCTGHGTILTLRLTDKITWEPFYRRHLPSAAPSTNSMNGKDSAPGAPNKDDLCASHGAFDGVKLAESIKAALWDATRRIRAAKSAAHARSLSHNPQRQSVALWRHWYEEDADTMRPHPFEALRREVATPWMRRAQLGASATHALEEDPTRIPIGSAHPLFTAGLLQLERGGSCVDTAAVQQEQWREMGRDERLFWERVELIRKGQLATIKGGVKRPYAEQADVVKDNVDDNVQLRFTQ